MSLSDDDKKRLGKKMARNIEEMHEQRERLFRLAEEFFGEGSVISVTVEYTREDGQCMEFCADKLALMEKPIKTRRFH